MISDSLYERLMKMSKKALFNLMLESLDEMQSYNGQSMTSAIMRAMGAKEVKDGKWFCPTTYKLNKDFSNSPPL